MIKNALAVFVLLLSPLSGNAFAQTAPSTQMMMQQTVDTIKKGGMELERKIPPVRPCKEASRSNAEGRAKPCEPAEDETKHEKPEN